jgi:hypothetical protein
MAIAKQAQEVLSSAERKLRELVGMAAGGGDYDTAERIMAWAKVLAELTAEHTSPETPSSKGVLRSPQPAAHRQSRTPTKGKYPQFFRRGDNLVKIGWSKTERKEYEHKTPRRVLDTLANAIARRSNNGKVFTAKQLFPLKDGDGSEFPGYQNYVALAWLRTVGLVKQHGRRGYTAKFGSQLPNAVISAWQTVSQHDD